MSPAIHTINESQAGYRNSVNDRERLWYSLLNLESQSVMMLGHLLIWNNSVPVPTLWC